MVAMEKTSQGVQSLEVGLDVLNVLVAAERPLMLKQVAGRAQMPPAKAHRYLASLCKYGYAKQNEAGLYALGHKALSMGLAATRRTDVLQWAQPSLHALHKQVGGYLQVCRWSDLGPLIIQFLDDEFGVPISAKVGAVMPILRSATGRVFASFLPETVVQPLAEKEAWLAWAEFLPLKAQIADQGVCVVEGEMMLGINAIAAPVFDENGELLWVVTCLGRAEQMAIDEHSVQVAAIKHCCQQLSQALKQGML